MIDWKDYPALMEPANENAINDEQIEMFKRFKLLLCTRY